MLNEIVGCAHPVVVFERKFHFELSVDYDLNMEFSRFS